MYFALFGAVCCSALLSICATAFNKRNTERNFSGLYNLLLTLSSFVVWLSAFIASREFEAEVLIYSLLFGIFYAMAFVGLFKALQNGSVSLTSFVKQLSLIGVAVWGFIFWDNPISSTVVTGLIIVLVSLWLCFKPQKDDKLNRKWLFWSLLLFLGNAGCSIVQKYEQLRYDQKYGEQLMAGATGVSVLLCLILYLRGDRVKLSELSKGTQVFPIVAGLSSAFLNLFVLYLISTPLSESVFFPVIGVGGIILTTLYSVGIQKEKLSKLKWAGLLVGLVGIIFLNV